MALNPADPRKILDTVPWDEGLAGRAGELSAESEEDEAGSDSFDAARESNDGVVPREEYDRVFADSRLEVVPTANDNEEWIEPVSRDELDVGGTYDYPDDYDETGDSEYDEMNTAFGYIAGREQTALERDLAQRTIRNLKGTPALAELEATAERIKAKIRTVVKEHFADVRTEDRRVEGFMGGYM